MRKESDGRAPADDDGGDEAESLAAAVIEAALDAIVTIDATGRVLRWNGAAERLFGYTRQEALGEPIADLIIPPDLQAAHWSGLRRTVAGDAPRILDRRVRMRARHRNGRELPVELTVTRESMDPVRFTGFLRDLSPLVAAEHRGTTMQRLLGTAEELAEMGSWEMDLGTRLTLWSPHMYRLAGLAPGEEQLTNERLLERVHEEDRDRIAALFATIETAPERIPEEGIAGAYRVRRRDGAIRHFRARGRIERDELGRPARWVGSTQDITDQLLTERELRAHYAVSQTLREWESFDEGVMSLLRRLGTALDFAVGSLWTRDAESGRLTCRAFWRAPGVGLTDFEEATRSMSVDVGEGIPGRVWHSRQPLITPDVQRDPRFRRREAAVKLGLRTGLAFPALGGDGPLAVLSYYSSDLREPSERLLQTLSGIGHELGRFIEPRRAELGSRRLSDRELEILKMAAEGNSGPGIAERLVLSPATVKTHFQNIYEKLGVSDRAAAVAYGLRTGLIR